MDLNSNEDRHIHNDDDAFVSSITFDAQASSLSRRQSPPTQPSSSPYHHRHRNYSNERSNDTVVSDAPFHRTNVGIIRIHRDYLHDLDDDIIRTLVLSSSSKKKKQKTTTTTTTTVTLNAAATGNNTINPTIKFRSDEQRTTRPTVGTEPKIDTNAGTNDTIRRNNSETHNNNEVRNQDKNPTGNDDGSLHTSKNYDEEANQAERYQQQKLDTNNEYDLSGQINSRLLDDCEILLVRRRDAKRRYGTVWNIATYIWIVSLVVTTILLLVGKDRTQQSQATAITTSTTLRRDFVVAIVIGNFVVAVGLLFLYTTYKSIDNEIQHIIKLVLPNSQHDDDENFVNRTTTMELGNEKEYRAMIDDQNNTNNTNTKIRHITDDRVGYKPPPPHHVHAHVPVGQIRHPPPPHGGAVSGGDVKGYKNRSNNRHHPLRRSNESQQAHERLPEPEPKRFHCK